MRAIKDTVYIQVTKGKGEKKRKRGGKKKKKIVKKKLKGGVRSGGNERPSRK